MADDEANFADRKAEAAALFERLAQQGAAIDAARSFADEHGLTYPEDIKMAINKIRTLLSEAGFTQAQVDALPGLGPINEGLS